MNSNSSSSWAVWFRQNRDSAVGALEKRWWYWGSPDASVCFCVPPGIDTPFARCFEGVDCEMVLGPLVVVVQDSAISEDPRKAV